jgi:membrane-bound lytic murein transglycosylase F
MEIEWDWRLLAALIYQESRFNPHAKSWAGAFGLMQLMPQTAQRFGIDTTHVEVENLEAGAKYIQFLERFWEKRIEDADERRKFVLASYNVGPGHVLDAQKIARKMALDPDVWDNNVADCLLLKSQPRYYQMEGVEHGYCRGEQPFAYVKHIYSHYEHFVQNFN